MQTALKRQSQKQRDFAPNTTTHSRRCAYWFVHRSNPMTTISNLISALIIVESSGNDLAIGDNGRAIGPLQIHKAVVLDVNRIIGSHYRHQDMTNRAQARAVCEAYLRHYGKGCTTEQLARKWNGGGPAGEKKQATEAYWNKVRKHLK
jgi:hypothetical protein